MIRTDISQRKSNVAIKKYPSLFCFFINKDVGHITDKSI